MKKMSAAVLIVTLPIMAIGDGVPALFPEEGVLVSDGAGNVSAVTKDNANGNSVFSNAVAAVADGLTTNKADRADSGDADEIATLDADGNPTRSGIAAEDVITTDGGTVDGDLEVTGNATIANLIVRDTVESLTVNSITISNTDPVELTTEDGVLADSNGKYAHLSKISATDPTFSNAVKTVTVVRDEPQNLKFTITANDGRFYFTPVGAINPED